MQLAAPSHAYLWVNIYNICSLLQEPAGRKCTALTKLIHKYVCLKSLNIINNHLGVGISLISVFLKFVTHIKYSVNNNNKLAIWYSNINFVKTYWPISKIISSANTINYTHKTVTAKSSDETICIYVQMAMMTQTWRLVQYSSVCEEIVTVNNLWLELKSLNHCLYNMHFNFMIAFIITNRSDNPNRNEFIATYFVAWFWPINRNPLICLNAYLTCRIFLRKFNCSVPQTCQKSENSQNTPLCHTKHK